MRTFQATRMFKQSPSQRSTCQKDAQCLPDNCRSYDMPPRVTVLRISSHCYHGRAAFSKVRQWSWRARILRRVPRIDRSEWYALQRWHDRAVKCTKIKSSLFTELSMAYMIAFIMQRARCIGLWWTSKCETTSACVVCVTHIVLSSAMNLRYHTPFQIDIGLKLHGADVFQLQGQHYLLPVDYYLSWHE